MYILHIYGIILKGNKFFEDPRMKKFLYHFVPKNMKGDILFPLNVLKDKHPDTYAGAVSKYDNRKYVMEDVVPGLGCLWNDVVHLTAVHPRDLKKALVETGGNPEMPIVCYEIDPDLLDSKNTVVYLYKYTKREKKFEEDNFVPFEVADISKYSHIPEVTKSYFRRTFQAGEQPLKFAFVPHVLYKGTIDISQCPIVRV